MSINGANPPNQIINASAAIPVYIVPGPTTTVAGLPAAATSGGATRIVSDSTVAGSGHFGSVVVGGGANIVPVYCDGTNWLIG
jgi:hypothetical protein